MDTLTAMQISGSALKAERTRLNIAAMNLANANTTRTMEGGPYKAKSVVFAAKPVEGVSFQDALNSTTERLRKVEVVQISEDKAPFKEVYDPTHPDADANGVVRFPNVNVAEQMVDMMSAKRSYEANVTALDAVKSMALKALEIGR
ncbi:MAG: flagellar basal body rod protein FlgC [Desulfurivibrionaceae bacterium]|jgi:flagellar basal-body rod protein FlgC|nr:flagellar basal body rod protein FlgC [Pseudomonadota bacterium]MCG2822741.1 flagellar basal body rod protein FlgC [Desulfobulbaceae bacterium]MDP2757761.1 flagellar basal body rod protein FlgC [Desulfurivibrionaceae bacterium]PKN21094.1 MAG: flagellar basal body rod protein FlgC [Deltaproteobacteria bacterium HGW-Deltaproteobacteria-3]